jgi:hypothetical protein
MKSDLQSAIFYAPEIRQAPARRLKALMSMALRKSTLSLRCFSWPGDQEVPSSSYETAPPPDDARADLRKPDAAASPESIAGVHPSFELRAK